MSEYKINTNYAKALYLLATELDRVEEVFADMKLVNKVCLENRELGVVINNPVIPEAKKVAILREVFEAHVSKVTAEFLCFVVKKRRTLNLKGISLAFIDQYRKAHDIVYTEMVTAVEVNDNLLDEVRQLIADFTQKKVDLYSRVDNKMLGGFKLTFDNNMYDARIRTKIKKLRNEFSKNIYESKL